MVHPWKNAAYPPQVFGEVVILHAVHNWHSDHCQANFSCHGQSQGLQGAATVPEGRQQLAERCERCVTETTDGEVNLLLHYSH